MVTINDAPAHGVGHFPFGGRKPDSGVGREGLGYSIDGCTELKTVVMPPNAAGMKHASAAISKAGAAAPAHSSSSDQRYRYP